MSIEYEKNLMCKTLLKTGPNSGLFCMRKNCNIKNHCNIARYLNLPKKIVEIFEKNKKLVDYNRLVNIFEKEFKDCDFEYVVNLLDNSLDNEIRLVIFIYIYMLFDTPFFRLHHGRFFHNFYELANEKLHEFSKCKNSKYKIFISYINEMFVANKRFFSRKKNLQYSLKTFKIYMICANRLNKFFETVVEKRYVVGGTGYLEARDRFYSLC